MERILLEVRGMVYVGRPPYAHSSIISPRVPAGAGRHRRDCLQAGSPLPPLVIGPPHRGSRYPFIKASHLGGIESDRMGMLRTDAGDSRVVDKFVGDPLPRIR